MFYNTLNINKKIDKKKILIVDDDPTILMSLTFYLSLEGVEVLTANRLKAAEEALSTNSFDLVITDIYLSKLWERCGLELLSYIKHCWPETKVIVMTAYGSEEIRKDALARGANYYCEKPFSVKELKNQLRDM